MIKPYTLHLGDCIEVMRTMPDNSVDSIVCDPPYGLEFMGKDWDGADGFRRSLNKADAGRDNTFGRMSKKAPEYRAGRLFQEWCEAWATEALRVLKPGGHLLAFSGTRTSHRMVCAIEDAGFEIRDSFIWVYASGMPKSRDISRYDMTGDDAIKWSGWGTGTKPAHEPCCMARKPLAKGMTVAANVLAHGTGALNIDGCRVEVGARPLRVNDGAKDENGFGNKGSGMAVGETTAGRWPANIIHSGEPEVVALFPAQAGGGDKREHGGGSRDGGFVDTGAGIGDGKPGGALYADTGSAARFFKTCTPDQDDFDAHVSMRQDCYNEECENQNYQSNSASTVSANSCQSKSLDAIALVHAANSELPEGMFCENHLEGLSTTATQNELKRIRESVTQTIQSIARKFWLGLLPTKLSLSLSHANVVVLRDQTGIMRITINLSKSDGYADPVTFNITPLSLEAGARGFEPSTASRFMYCAKASRADRNEGLADPGPQFEHGSTLRKVEDTATTGNTHPTVKPVSLMQYLVRLVTPPGGLVLDPFMGSGSTGKACMREGFRFVGIDMTAEYHPIAAARIEHELAKVKAAAVARAIAEAPPAQMSLI